MRTKEELRRKTNFKEDGEPFFNSGAYGNSEDEINTPDADYNDRISVRKEERRGNGEPPNQATTTIADMNVYFHSLTAEQKEAFKSRALKLHPANKPKPGLGEERQLRGRFYGLLKLCATLHEVAAKKNAPVVNGNGGTWRERGETGELPPLGTGNMNRRVNSDEVIL